MMKRHTAQTLAAIAALTLAALVAPVAQAQTPAKAGAPMPGMAASSSMTAGGMDMKAMMKDMNDKMASMLMSGKQDIDFAMMMRIHHQGAISMAQAELGAGKEPQMKKMAKDIIAAQKKEIAEIDKFLAKHGHPMNK